MPTLRHIVAAFASASPGSGFCVRTINKRLCFARGGSGIKLGAWPVEQYVLTIMIQALRYLIGSEWTPDEVFLQAPRQAHQLRGLEQSTYLAAATIHTGQACTAVGIPNHVGAPSAIDAPEAALESSAGMAMATRNLESSLRQVLAPYLSGGYPNEGLAAEICGTSIRTLRRRLHDEGTTYRDVVSSVRFHAARRMLADKQMKLIDIAYALGYQDPGSFSRAFHTWTGLAPSVYRRAKTST
jgi:AraC-like DNA-binding protein